MVTTDDGGTDAFTCPGDGVADVIQFVNTGPVVMVMPISLQIPMVDDVVTEVIPLSRKRIPADFEDDGIGI